MGLPRSGVRENARSRPLATGSCACKYSVTLPAASSRYLRRLCAVPAASALACLLAALALSPALGLSPAAAAPTAGPCPGAGLRPTRANVHAVDSALLCLVNRIRVAHGLPALRANRELGTVASGQVRQMVRMNYFADVRPTGQTPLALVDATRYPVKAARVSVGQNIAWGTGRYTTPENIVAAWMASPPHRQIMLDGQYRDTGVGVTPATPSVIGAGQAGATYAIELGLRQP